MCDVSQPRTRHLRQGAGGVLRVGVSKGHCKALRKGVQVMIVKPAFSNRIFKQLRVNVRAEKEAEPERFKCVRAVV
jgi:hypothetical protein